MPKILIVDDEKSIRGTLKEILLYEKYKVEEAKDGEEAWELLKSQDFDVVLCDIKMPKMDGMELLSLAKNEGIQAQFIMITAHGNIETAVEATKKGAFDFIPKPPDLNRLLVTIRNAMDKSLLVQETKKLKRKAGEGIPIIGESSKMKELKDMVSKIAPTEARVLIIGPNGVGKELVAKAIHAQSSRSHFPLVEVNCAAIPSELIESELFGHEKGSFTSALKQRIGKFELADGGTLFLDEIGDMGLEAQAKVLRALQEKKIARVGGEKDISVDVRVIAATNKDLTKEIENKKFREDLYHRIGVIIVPVPALKDRAEDIPLLVEYFLEEIGLDYGTKKKTITLEALNLLKEKPWTGNVRELRNVVERLVILGGTEISQDDVVKFVV